MLDHIGDVLWKTPALAALRKNLPQCEITALLTPYVKEVLEGNPAVDRLLVYDSEACRLPAQKKQFRDAMKAVNFDWAICFDPRDEANSLAYYSGAGLRAGFFYTDKPLSVMKSLLTLNHRWIHPAQSAKKTGNFPHEVEVNLQLLKNLGLEQEAGEQIVLELSPADRKFASDLLQNRKTGLALHLESKWFSGNWSRDYLAELLESLAQTCQQTDILITYGSQGEILVKELASRLSSRFIFAGGLSFKQWAALLEHCKVLVCRDGGSAHVASAVNRKVVTIFERDKFREHKRWVPWNTEYRAIFREEEQGANPKMVKQHIAEVLLAALELHGE